MIGEGSWPQTDIASFACKLHKLIRVSLYLLGQEKPSGSAPSGATPGMFAHKHQDPPAAGLPRAKQGGYQSGVHGELLPHAINIIKDFLDNF